jgi:multidrug resistance efflux pump
MAPVAAIVALLAVAGIGYQVWRTSQRIEIEDASISAPQVPVRSSGGGTLRQVYAAVGDEVRAHRPIARVGNEVITSDVPGTVVGIRDDVGSFIAAGSIVAWLIDRDELRAVGLVDEDEGLADLRVGQRATVKADTWGGREFFGTVEEISDRPHRQDVQFSISEKREQRQYEVKVRFDGRPDPGLKQGMSARIWVRKQ